MSFAKCPTVPDTFMKVGSYLIFRSVQFTCANRADFCSLALDKLRWDNFATFELSYIQLQLSVLLFKETYLYLPNANQDECKFSSLIPKVQNDTKLSEKSGLHGDTCKYTSRTVMLKPRHSQAVYYIPSAAKLKIGKA